MHFILKVEKIKIHLVRLAPNAFDSERCGSDLPTGLLPVQMQKNLKGKPQSGVTYWTLEHFFGLGNKGKNLALKVLRPQV